MLGYGPAYYFLGARGTAEPEMPIKEGSRAAWHRRLSLDIGEETMLDTEVLAVAHPSDRGFRRAGLGAAEHYPDDLKAFIADYVRPVAAEAGR